MPVGPGQASRAAPARTRGAGCEVYAAAVSLPKIVDVEPIIAAHPAIILEPGAVPPERLLDLGVTPFAREIREIGQGLEIDLIPAPATVQPDHQNDRTAHDS